MQLVQCLEEVRLVENLVIFRSWYIWNYPVLFMNDGRNELLHLTTLSRNLIFSPPLASTGRASACAVRFSSFLVPLARSEVVRVNIDYQQPNLTNLCWATLSRFFRFLSAASSFLRYSESLPAIFSQLFACQTTKLRWLNN